MKRKLLFMMAFVISVLGVNAQDAGTYYVQNVGNGRWLGPGNNWGTQASTLEHADYWKLAKISDGVYTMESVVSNGGTSYYLSGTYCDGGATQFTLTPVSGKENVYTISTSAGYLNALTNNTVDMSGSASSESSQWKLFSETDMSAMMSAATVDAPADATYLIKDHDLGRNNRDYSSWSNTGATAPKTSDKQVSGTSVYSVEAYHVVFDVNQTLSGVPNGVYAVKVNGFYRQDGSDANLPYVYGNDGQATLPARTGSENNMQAAAVSFVAGNYLSDAAYVKVTDGTLKVGVATTGTSCWAIFKNFHLYYYGDVEINEVLLAGYVNAYRQALASAQSYQDDDMFDADKTALNTAITNNTLDLSDASLTAEQFTTATNALNAAAAAAKLAASQYAFYNGVKALVDAGQTNVDVTNVTNDQNFSFEMGNLTAWTSEAGGNVANNGNFSLHVGNWFAESWKNNVALGNGVLTHDALVLPAGLYTISVNAQNIEQYNNNVGGTGYFLDVNSERVEIGAANTYSLTVLLTGEKNEVVIKMVMDNCTGNWVSCDEFKIQYLGEDFPAYTLAEGPMNSGVRNAQTAADAAFKAQKNAANYTALTAAITNAQASVDAYRALLNAITISNSVLSKTNVYDASQYETFTGTLTQAQQGYDAETLTTTEANTLANQIIGRGWRVKYSLADLLISSWDAVNDWTTYYINTWSVEGDASNSSGMTVPFIEYWTGDGAKLADRVLTATLPELENGLYEVEAFVRVMNKKTTEGDTGYDGISLAVTDGDPVEFADATEYPDGYAKTIKAEGLVKDGTLIIKVAVEGTNASWLAVKDVKYTKVRDLTEEEMAIAPTSIVLDPTKVTLTSETNTATLTPTFEPENASKNVTWTSSDESVATVADGVVTGVAPGTATITVTSSIDETVSASATVTVAYTETTVPAITYVNDGPKRTYSSLGENIIKNGAFEYPDAFYNWTQAKDFTTKITSAKFNVAEEDGNKYLVGTVNEGAGGEGSLGVAWPIEAGKSYVFSYRVKNLNATDGNHQYLVTSLTNAKGTETKVLGTPSVNKGQWATVKYAFTNDEEYQFLQIKFRWLSNQFGFDDFYLCEATTTEVGNVDYITENVPTSNIGDGVFQYNQDNIDAATGLTQATPVNQYTGATVSEVQAAYDRMMTLNPPARNSRYALVVATPNHAKAGNAVVAKAGNPSNNNPTGYGFNASAEPNVNLAQAWAFKAVEGKLNTYNLYYTNENDENVYLTYGALNGSAASWKDTQIQATTVVDNAGEFQIVATSRNNVVNIMNTITNSTIACQDGGNIYTEAGNADFTVQLAEPAVIEVAIAEGAYATRMFPFKPEIPSGVVCYEVEEMNGTSLVLKEVSDPQANTPYILYSEEAEIGEDVEGYGTATSLEPVEKGLLVGTLADENTVPAGNYVLQTLTNGQKFYKVASDITNYPAYRAYLKGSEVGDGVKEIGFADDDTPTGINAISEGGFNFSNIEGVYDLSGAKIGRLQKGTNVVRMKDGSVRKVLVK